MNIAKASEYIGKQSIEFDYFLDNGMYNVTLENTVFETNCTGERSIVKEIFDYKSFDNYENAKLFACEKNNEVLQR